MIRYLTITALTMLTAGVPQTLAWIWAWDLLFLSMNDRRRSP